jgi:hypothetical protein
MKIRFDLHEQLDADLIAHIQSKANGGPTNRAAKLLMQNWYAIECDRKMTFECSASDDKATNNKFDFSDLDNEFGE